MSKIIMHIDLNAFFATAQVIKEPELEGKPLIIAGKTRRGIVSTASYEARKYGINSAMPTYMALKLCPNVIVRDVDFDLYQRLSNQFFNYVKRYTPLIEIASIDECYADMTEAMKGVKDPEAYLRKLQNELYNETKLKCSIGLAPTKFLAKMGSDYKKPMGVTIIRRKDIQKIIWPLKIKDMFGVGKKTYPKLEQLGVKTIGDFARDESPEVKKLLGKFYYVLKDWALGQGSDIVQVEPDDPKSISHSRTFLFDTDDYEEIKSKIYELSVEVSNRAKKEKKLGKTVTFTYKDSNFVSKNKSFTMKAATNDVDVIYNNAINMFEKYAKDVPIRLVGVALNNLIDTSQFYVQMSLFDAEKHREECATKLLIDEINNKMKNKLLIRASDLKKEGKKDENK